VQQQEQQRERASPTNILFALFLAASHSDSFTLSTTLRRFTNDTLRVGPSVLFAPVYLNQAAASFKNLAPELPR
jgi:hypothetical protein